MKEFKNEFFFVLSVNEFSPYSVTSWMLKGRSYDVSLLIVLDISFFKDSIVCLCFSLFEKVVNKKKNSGKIKIN